MSNDLLKKLNDRLDTAEPVLTRLDKYYAGEQPLAFLSPEAKDAIGQRFDRMTSNLPRLAVTSLAERLRVTGFTRGRTPDTAVWEAWKRCDMDQLAPLVHREALTLARSYVIVWADAQGRARVSVESARQVTTLRDPASRQVVAALKRWVGGGRGHAVLYEPDRVTRFLSDASVADPAAMPPSAWSVVETLPNPLGVVPVVPFVNTDRLLDFDGRSEMEDLIPLVDALNKTLADLMVSSEYFARPRRWATGVELDEEDVVDEQGQPTRETVAVNPYPEGHRMMIQENPEARFGSLPAGDLGGHESAVRVLLGQIMAVSALPSHYVGVQNNQPASADALRAAEASLAARAEARQMAFGRAWEQVAQLMVAAETGVDPLTVDTSVTWADPTTRSVAQEADAVVKLHTAGLLPSGYALKRLGYSDGEITAIREDRQLEAIDKAAADVLTGGAA